MKILEIKFKHTEKPVEITTNEEVEKGEEILINNGQIVEYVYINKIKEKSNVVEENSEISFLRKLTDKDKEKIEKIKKKIPELLSVCHEKIQKHELVTMKLLNADMSFDEKKITFYFSAEGRVDFRDLVSDLIKTFKKLIRLQQVGARDEAKLVGGFGKCGRELCCASFLNNMESITLDMAKDQEIMSSSNKLSGLCGKLMCCLYYELEEYKEMAKKLPKIGEEVSTKQGTGRVISRNILKQKYTIENKDGQKIEVIK